MTGTSGLSPAPGSAFKSVVTVMLGYLFVTVLAASATPLFGGKNPALAIWLVGGLILLVAVARLTSRGLVVPNRAKRVALTILVSLAVSGVTMFVGFVLVVNIWKRLGLGH